MIDEQTFESLLVSAYQWAKAKEQFVLASGMPLGRRERADARRAGVQDGARIRVLVADRIPMPECQVLTDAARRNQIITETSRGMTIGHGIIIRADCWGDRELLVHQFVHIAQCERLGGLEPYLHQYLRDRRTCAQFTKGTFEDEANRVAREICTTAAPDARVASVSAVSNADTHTAPAKS